MTLLVSPVYSAGNVVGTSTSFSATDNNSQRKSFYANGRHWQYWFSGSQMVWASSTDGVTWGSSTAIATITLASDFSVWFDGTNVHYAYANSGATGNAIKYRRGVPNSDGTITYAAVEQTARAGATNVLIMEPTIAVDTNLRPMITYLYLDPSEFQWANATKSSATDGTWSVNAGFPYKFSTSNGWLGTTLVPLQNGNMYAFYVKSGSSGQKAKWYNNTANSWSSEQTPVGTLSMDTTTPLGPISAVAESDSDVHYAFAETTSNDLHHAIWTMSTQTWGSVGTINASTSLATVPVLSINQTSGTVYAYYAKNDILYYRVYSGSWGSQTTLADESSVSLREENINVFYQFYSNKDGVTYVKKNASPFNVTYIVVSEIASNNAPTIGSPSGTNWDDTDNLYAQKKSYTVSVTYTDLDGYADFDYVELYLKTGANTTRAQFRYDEDTNAVSTESGSSTWTLDSIAGDFTESGNTIVASWEFTAQWDATEESDLDFLFCAVDDNPASINSVSDQNFDVVTRLVTSSFTSDDGRINVGGTTTISGVVYYANAPGSNTASSSYPPDAEFTSVSVHDSAHVSQATDSTIVNGAFSVAFAIPGSVQSNTYHAYINLADADGTDQDALDGDMTAVIGDSLTASITDPDQRININANASGIQVSAIYNYDSAAFDGTLTLNSTTFQYATVGKRGYTVASASGGTYGITTIGTNDSTYSIWDSLVVYSIQTVEYLGSGVYRYIARIKYGYDSSTINGAGVNITLPSGVSIGQAMSNSSGWAVFVLSQVNASAAGSYTLFGVSEPSYGVTVPGANQTLVLRAWTLATEDVDGNELTDTEIYVNKTISVWSGNAASIRIPEDTFSVEVYWLQDLILNTTASVVVSGNTNTTFSCSAYPYVIDSIRYWVASNATISSAVFASNIMTVQFNDTEASYILVSSSTTKPSYIRNALYDLDDDFSTYLILNHYANTTIDLAYLSWGGVYVHSLTHYLYSASWDAQVFTLIFNGSTSEVGTVEIYSGTRGAPGDGSGFATFSYSSSTKLITGTFVFASQKTVTINWESSGQGGSGGPGGTSFGTSVLIGVRYFFPAAYPGRNATGTLQVDWVGPRRLYLYQLTLGNATDWVVIEGLPKMLERALDKASGNMTIPITVTVPSFLLPGNYTLAAKVYFRTEADQDIVMAGLVSFQVYGGPTTAPEFMTILFLAVIGVMLFGAMFRGKSRKQT